MQYRKKPVVIEAERVKDVLNLAAHDWKSLPVWIQLAYSEGDLLLFSDTIAICTLEGRMIASKDDWLICGVSGELYPCKPDIFAITYELVE